jgi:hypothetical protein
MVAEAWPTTTTGAARGKRVALVVLGVVATLVAGGGIMHLPFARGVLMRLGGCPVGHASTTEIEPARNAAVATERGKVDAPARPALGFTLDKTTPEDARAWAAAAHVACNEVRGGLLRCANVPAAALGVPQVDGEVSELFLGFDSHARLVDVVTMRHQLPTRAAVDAASEIATRLATTLGAPQGQSGTFDAARLSQSGVASLGVLRYRFHDYFVDLTAMRVGGDGLVVREHYLSATD